MKNFIICSHSAFFILKYAVVDSIGILPDGQVTVCAWAIDENCCLFEGFRLGKLPEDNLDEILERVVKTPEYSERTKFCRTTVYTRKDNKKEVE